MSTNKKEAVNASAQAKAAQTTKKPRRRGVSNETHAVSQLKFHEKDAASNNLFIGHLEDVSVQWSQNADGKAFTGMKIPRLTFVFASNHKNKAERRYVYQSLFPQESNVDTIPDGKDAWKVDNVLNWIKHILDVFYLKGREMTEEEEDALTLPFADYDDNGEYVEVPVEDVIAGYTALFTNTASILNGQWNLADGEEAHPCYKDEKGAFIPIWMKLLRYKKVKNEWRANGQNGDLAFDPFIGAGAIELAFKKNGQLIPPVRLRVDLSKESITPKEVRKAPNAGIPGVPADGGVVADGIPTGGAEVPSAYVEAADDMPF